MSELAKLNDVRRQEILALRDTVMRRRPDAQPASSAYPLAVLKSRIADALHARSGRANLEWELDLLDRAKFGADVALRVTGLLKEDGAKEYVASHIPWIAETMRDPALSDAVAEVSQKGIYVNLRLTDEWFRDSVGAIVRLAEHYGANDSMADRTAVIDYSAPNVAKVLHAGHLRSTIIGHVLGNLYQACGALVYRVNHINDFGGFGFMLEGYRRFADRFPDDLFDNDRSLMTYMIRRALERAAGSGAVADADRAIITRYFPELNGADTAEITRVYEEYVAAAEARFRRLEQGDPDEVALWQRMVEWSLADFRRFYQALDINIDFVIGESFYYSAGDAVVDAAIAQGRAYVLTQAMIDNQIVALDKAVTSGDMTPAARDQAAAGLAKDLGAVVAPLPGGERYVVRHSDGHSIYATRDLGAIKLRQEIFRPTDINYVVGQEQRVHFARLFQAAESLGLLDPKALRLRHTYFGFYVDAATGRKLSSRDSVAGVNELLAESVKHYWAKTAASGGMTEDEIDHAAHQLAVGSVVFNDLKSDMKGAVGIATGDVGPTIAAFEKSGGPYVVYTACRARAILRRYSRALPDPASITTFDVSDQEALLILKLLEFAEKVARAAAEDNAAVLVRHLLDVAGAYNSYYAVAPVLRDGVANEFRLLITRSAQLTLVNGLRALHVECPPKI